MDRLEAAYAKYVSGVATLAEPSDPVERAVVDVDSRNITIPESLQLAGVMADNHVKRIYFQVSKQAQISDLSQFDIHINYINAQGEADRYSCDDKEINGDNVTFSWLISDFATKYRGQITFIVCMDKANGEHWNSTIAHLNVLEGLETSETIAEQNPDIIEEILRRLDELEESGGGGGTGKNGVTFTPHVSEDGLLTWTNDGDLMNPDPVNIKGQKGEPGEPGQPGTPGEKGDPGENGETPTIGSNGNWYIGSSDTGKPSRGEKGADGKAATVQVGNVTTGNIASVTNSGTETDAILDFVIPSGGSGTPPDYENVKKNSQNIWIDQTLTYSIESNRDSIFDAVKNSKANKITITDGSNYWDAEETTKYPSVLDMETIRKNRFYSNMWLPNGLDIEQSYRYAVNKNGHIRLYDINTQKSDLTGIGPWGIALRANGKEFPTSAVHFIISAFKIIGLNSVSGKWELIKKQRPIAAIYDIEKTSSEGTYLQIDREDLGNDMYSFPVRNSYNWVIDGGEMCFHFYNQLEDAISSDDLEPYSKVIVDFRAKIQEKEYENVFTVSAGCDAYGSESSIEAFFGRFNALTADLTEYNANNVLESESDLITDALMYIDEIISDNGNETSGSETYTLPIASENVLGGVKAISKTTEIVPVAADSNGKLWVPDQSSGETENAGYSGKTVVMFGDSIVAGWGWQEGYGITKPLSEKYPGATWDNQAVSGSDMANRSGAEHPSIISKINAYSGNADGILLEGGTNDVNNGVPLGSITSGYDDSFDETTFTGALESALKKIMNQYPMSYKMFLIPHNFAKDNSFVDSYHDRAAEVCEKWNVPVLDMRKRLQLAMTTQNKNAYTHNPNTKSGDGVHPNEELYRKFYSPLVDQFFRSLGILNDMAGTIDPPENIPVTSVTLSENRITLTKSGQTKQLAANVNPSNATNKSVTWESDHPEIASVTQNGLVTATGEGNATITVKTSDGNKTASCQVNVEYSEIPDHTELDYISVNKTAYFDTGITPDLNTKTEISVWIDHTELSGTYIAGARDSNYKIVLSATNNFYAARGGLSSVGKNFAMPSIQNIAIVFRQEGNMAYANEKYVQLDEISTLDLTTHYMIGNCSNGSTVFENSGLIGRINYAKIYDGENLVRDFIPVRKNNELCLYDKITQTYFYNMGSGTLVGSDENVS